jgi:hypothetical protein
MLQKLVRWDDRLALEIALHLEGSGDSLGAILKAHSISPPDFLTINEDPVFQQKVTGYRDDIQNKGLSFKLKARVQAEHLLQTSYALIHDPDTSPAVKADLIKSTVKWAGYEPRGTEDGGGATGGVKITINLGNNTPAPLASASKPVISATYSSNTPVEAASVEYDNPYEDIY